MRVKTDTFNDKEKRRFTHVSDFSHTYGDDILDLTNVIETFFIKKILTDTNYTRFHK